MRSEDSAYEEQMCKLVDTFSAKGYSRTEMVRIGKEVGVNKNIGTTPKKKKKKGPCT